MVAENTVLSLIKVHRRKWRRPPMDGDFSRVLEVAWKYGSLRKAWDVEQCFAAIYESWFARRKNTMIQ